MNVTHLYCSSCDKQYEPRRLYNLCDCGKPLMVAYNLDRAQATLTRQSLADRVPTLWRYEEVLPVDDRSNRITPEGGTCLPALRQLIERGKVSRDKRVVLFNTGSGLKYLDDK